MDNVATPTVASAQELQLRVNRAMRQILRDPGSTSYGELRSGLGGSICGTVNLARRAGGELDLRPFVVSPEGAAFLSGSPGINIADALDPFVDAHMRWCASPEELRSIQDSLANIAVAAPSAPLSEDIPELSSPAPSEPPMTNPNAPATPFNEQSERDLTFQNAVVRSSR